VDRNVHLCYVSELGAYNISLTCWYSPNYETEVKTVIVNNTTNINERNKHTHDLTEKIFAYLQERTTLYNNCIMNSENSEWNKLLKCIPMGKNCAALLADLFFYSRKADFMHGFLNTKMKKLTQPFNFTFSCIDDVL